MSSGDPLKNLSLENLDGLTGLAGLTDRTGVDTRPILLRVLTDLYVQKPSHTQAEERHYVELALRLIEVVDPATRATVLEKLVAYSGAPADVLRRLRVTLYDAQEPTDAPSPTPPADPWLEDDLGIFEPIAKPATPTPPTTKTHAADDYVAERETFFASDATARRQTLLTLEHTVDVEPVALAQGTNIVRYLEQAALAGRFQEFTTLLQQSLGTSRSLTQRIIADPLGEPFVVAAKALALPTDTFQRILMFLNPSISHSVDRVYQLSDLFADLPLSAALRVIAIWRAADRMEARTALHRPLHSRDTAAATRTEQKSHQAGSQRPETNPAQRRTPSGS